MEKHQNGIFCINMPFHQHKNQFLYNLYQMKKLFYFLGLISVLALSNACGNASSKALKIEGEIEGSQNLQVFLDRSDGQTTTVLNQTEANSKGKFNLILEEKPGPGIYRIRIGAKRSALILDGTESKINITGNLDQFSKNTYALSGSPSTEEYNEIMTQYFARKVQVQQIQEFVDNAQNPFGALQLLQIAIKNNPDFAHLYRAIGNRLMSEYPDHPNTQGIVQVATALEQQKKLKESQQKIKVGLEAPDIALEDPNGEIKRLSDLEGKVVLLDFWASWCGPCRKSNPHLVEVYKKYKDKGFTVYSVSLDGLDTRKRNAAKANNMLEASLENQKKRWLNAIEKDQLEWDSHVSDLRKWECAPAREYGVTSIPKTFLIDRDGKIAAVNPRYNLEEELLKIL